MEENRRPTRVDEGVDPTEFSREWLEQTLSSIIIPRVADVRIYPVPLASGRVTYIVDIPQATTFAPHMSRSKKYHRRLNFTTVDMEGYEVKDAMRRANKSHPILWFELTRDPPTDAKGLGLKLRAQITNLSDEPAIYACLRILLDRRLFNSIPTLADFFPGEEMHVQDAGGHFVPVYQFSRNIVPPQHMPIFKEQHWTVVSLNIERKKGVYMFGYSVTCPGFSDSLTCTVSMSEDRYHVVEAGRERLFQAPANLSFVLT